MRSYLCTKDLYKSYLLATSIRYSGLALSEVSPTPLSHDAVSRWLKNKVLTPSLVWKESSKLIDKKHPCLLIGDDTVCAKTNSKTIESVHYQYSGNAHKVIAGIGLVNILWHDKTTDVSVPVDYRVYDKDTDGKTKNTLFREMLKSAKARGITPDHVVTDTWYSSLDNLKCIRSLGWQWVAGLRKNRKVNRNETLENLEIPDEGLKMHLRGYGWVKVFRFVRNERRTDYIATSVESHSRHDVQTIMKARWSIEVYHRELKQTCGLERCMSRTGRAQRNHICVSVLAWLERFMIRKTFHDSFYRQQWNNIKQSITLNMKISLNMMTA